MQPAGDDGAGLRLGGARQQLVLAMLLAQPNSVVSTDALVDGLWGDSPPSAARHTVQGYVSELRKLLGPVIERSGAGYVVRVDRASLDSLEFETLISEGRAALAEDPEVAAEMLRAGLRLWRGPPFSGLDDSGVLLAERTRLVELQLLALEDRVAAELASGRHREVAAELDALCRQHPYREGLRAQHMVALYRSGRQAEALRAFQQTRAVLVDELGKASSDDKRTAESEGRRQSSTRGRACVRENGSGAIASAGRKRPRGRRNASGASRQSQRPKQRLKKPSVTMKPRSKKSKETAPHSTDGRKRRTRAGNSRRRNWKPLCTGRATSHVGMSEAALVGRITPLRQTGNPG